MKRTSLALLMVVTSGAMVTAAACSDSSGGAAPAADAGGDGTAGDGGDGNYQLEVTCTDTLDSIYAAPPAMLPADKGAIIRCAKDKDISKAELEAAAKAGEPATDVDLAVPGYAGKAFTSGARTYRILYRTERGDANNTAGYASALVYVPDAPRAAKSPIVVASHGSRGQAAKCAPSKQDPAGNYVNGDYIRQVYPLIGSGYAVIASDLAGYANYGAAGNAPSTYASAGDAGKSTLDAARALKKLLSKSLTDKTILVGHSQGGGTALSGLALSSTYAPEIDIAGVAVYSPLWISARANGAFLLFPQTYKLGSSAVPSVILWYLYTHGELMDGQGHGGDIFLASKKDVVKTYVDNDCWARSYPDLEAAGTSANDFLDPAFIQAIKNPAAGIGGDCSTSSDPALCQKWMDRFVADWPHFTGKAAQVPILSLYGGGDETITPDIAACVFTRYKADTANYKVCFDPAGTHPSIVSLRADYVNDWIAARSLGGAEPAACPSDESALKDDAGAAVQCNGNLPPN